MRDSTESLRNPLRWRYTATVAASDDILTRILTVVHVQPCKLLRASLDLDCPIDEQVIFVVEGLQEPRAFHLLHRLERLIGVQSVRCEPLPNDEGQAVPVHTTNQTAREE